MGPSAGRALLGDMSWSGLLPVIRFGYGLALAVLLSKHLSVEQYGQWSLFISTMFLVLTVSSLNLTYAATVILTGKDIEDQRRDIFSVAVTKYAATLVVYLGFALYLAASDTFALEVVVMLGVVVIAKATNDLFFGLLRALLQVARQVRFVAFESVAIIALVGMTTWGIGWSWYGAVWAYLVAELLTIVLGVVYLREYLTWTRLDRTIIRQYLRIGLPLIPFAFSDLIINALVPFLIRIYESFEAVALYSIAQKVALAAALPNAVINNVYMQYLKKAKEAGGIVAVKHTLRRFLLIYLVLIVPVLTGLVLFGQEMIRLISTEAYMGSYILALKLAGVNVIVMLSALLMAVFAVYDRTRTVGWIWMVVLVFYVISNQWLVPEFGLDGIAYALLLSFAGGLAAIGIAAARLIRSLSRAGA
ncbi:MAG: oligosaccharide flippase family protein [bacterium]